MGSPFKMNPKTPLMKALTGKQGNLPQELQDAIKAAPESPAKSYGESPAKKTGKKLTDNENKAISDYRRGAGRADVTKKGSVVKGSESRKLGEGMAPKGTKKAGSAGARYAGKDKPGDVRKLVVREKTASTIKEKGVDMPKSKNIGKKKSPAKMKGVKALKKK